MQTISINFVVPQGWHELSDKQLRYAYSLIASDFATDEIKTLCLLQWSGTKVIGQQASGSYLLKKGKILFEVTPLTLAELLPHLDWLGALPTVPVRISKINRAHALPADFSEVPFETYIIVDNLYQGYLQTQSDDLLDELANVLYGKPITQTLRAHQHLLLGRLAQRLFRSPLPRLSSTCICRHRRQSPRLAVPQPRFRYHSSCCRSRIFLLCLCLSCFF